MHLTQFLLAGVVAATSAHAGFVAKDMYMQNVALGQLARLSDYRVAHADTLSEAQGSALDLMADVVKNFATDKVDAAKSACVAAFGEDECSQISGTTSGLALRNAEARAVPDCTCATLDDTCNGKKKCVLRKNNNCGYASYSCGFLWIYPCDGRCH